MAMIKRVLISICVSCLLFSSTACTAFMIKSQGNIFLCKNFDWEDGVGLLRYNPAGKVYFDEDTETSWQAIYSSITFCYSNAGFTTGGMNEKGLVIEELSALPFPYCNKADKIQLNEFQWISYHLDKFASVEEVVKNQGSINLVPVEHYLHYIIADAHGDEAIIEVGPEGILVYRGKELPYPVLSNNPYEQSVKYLSRFSGYGGEMAIRRSSASCDRFVRGVDLVQRNRNSADCTAANCFNMLDTLRQNDTQWQIVYDIPDRKIYFREQGTVFRHCIDVVSFNNTIGTKGLRIYLHGFKGFEKLCELVKCDEP